MDNLKRIDGYQLAAVTTAANIEFAKSGTVIEVTGKNDGPQIDKVEKVWGLNGEPYCAMGQYWVFAKKLADLCNIEYNNDPKSPKYCVKVFAAMRQFIRQEYLLFHPACAYMINAAMKRGQWRVFDDESDMQKLVQGDYIFYDWNWDDDDHPQRHVEQVVMVDGRHIVTVGWNTRADSGDPGKETNDPAGGGGCFVKHRSPDARVILGYIRWQRR